MNPACRIALYVVLALLHFGCATTERMYVRSATEAFATRQEPKEEFVSEADLGPLPTPVQRYLHYAGVVGRPKVWNMRVEMEAEMFQKPGDAPLAAVSEQHNFFDDPTRLFYMEATMFGFPVGVLHRYSETHATMLVRIADAIPVVDQAGPVLDTTETVTVLNDMAVMAPGTLVDPRLTWRAIDDSHSEVTFRNRDQEVRATLHFGNDGELVNFVSDDRSALVDGVFVKRRFSTPLRAYRDFGGVRLASQGDTVFDYPEGPFRYASFVLKRVRYNVPCFEPRAIGATRPTRTGIALSETACARSVPRSAMPRLDSFQ